MILIADSGSTKTSWSWSLPSGKWETLTTDGLNPLTSKEEQISEILSKVCHKCQENTLNTNGIEIHFYGAGCGTDQAKQYLNRLLSQSFPKASIEVQTDLMGACRALWPNAIDDKPHIVGILGTGSNACLFDGDTILENPPSLGFLLGDEGSGNHIGRHLLKDFIRKYMPSDLSQLFQEKYHLTYSKVIDQLYHQPNANRYLAGFTLFAANHRDHPFIHNLLEEVFGQFFDEMISPLSSKTKNLLLMGSVAVQFEEEIREIAQHHGFTVPKILKQPMSGLITFHLENQKNS